MLKGKKEDVPNGGAQFIQYQRQREDNRRQKVKLGVQLPGLLGFQLRRHLITEATR